MMVKNNAFRFRQSQICKSEAFSRACVIANTEEVTAISHTRQLFQMIDSSETEGHGHGHSRRKSHSRT